MTNVVAYSPLPIAALPLFIQAYDLGFLSAMLIWDGILSHLHQRISRLDIRFPHIGLAPKDIHVYPPKESIILSLPDIPIIQR